MVTGKCTDVFRGIFLVLGGELKEGVTWEDVFMKELLMGGRDFQRRGRRIFKKERKNRYQKFFLLKVRSSIKT